MAGVWMSVDVSLVNYSDSDSDSDNYSDPNSGIIKRFWCTTVQAGWIFKIPPVAGGQIFFPTEDPLFTRLNLPPALIFCPPQLHRDPSAKPLNYLSENAVGETLSLMAIRIMLVTSEWLTGAFVWRSQTSIIIKKKKKRK